MITDPHPSILIISTKSDIATDYVILSLEESHSNFYRVNTEELTHTATASFQLDGLRSNSPSLLWHNNLGKAINLSEVKTVWFRRHRVAQLAVGTEPAHEEYCLRETDWFMKGMIYSLTTSPDVAWMNHPAQMQMADSKLYQLAQARLVGFNLPRTLVSNDPHEVRSFFHNCKAGVIAKPLRLGYFDYGYRKSCVFTTQLQSQDLIEEDAIRVAPVIYQELVEKDCDIRVTIVGDRVFSASIDSQSVESAKIDWRQSDTDKLPHSIHQLPDSVKNKCLSYMKRLGLTYGAIDLILRPDGEYIFLEINAGGQWIWLEDRLDLPISRNIAQWLKSR